MYLQSLISRLKDVQELAFKTVKYINTCLIDRKSENDQKQQNHQSSDSFESKYYDQSTSSPISSKINEMSNLDEITSINEITDYDEKSNESAQLYQNESTNQNQNQKENIEDLKNRIRNIKNNVNVIINDINEIIKDGTKAIKLPNHPFIRRMIKLTPYIFDWISNATSETIDKYLFPKIKSHSYLITGAVGSLFNVGSSFLCLIFVRSSKWEAFKEAAMWGGSFFAEHLGDYIASKFLKDNSGPCIHDVIYDAVNTNEPKRDIHTLNNINNICDDHSKNHFSNDIINEATDIILHKCLNTNLKSIWYSTIITISLFAFGVFFIKLICNCIRKHCKNNEQKDESF